MSREADVSLDVYLSPCGYQADFGVRTIKVVGSCRDFATPQDVDEMTQDLLERLRDTIEQFRKGRNSPGGLDDD